MVAFQSMSKYGAHGARFAISTIGLALGVVGCGSADPGSDSVASVGHALLGDNVAGIVGEEDLLDEARTAFSAVEGLEDGVGPIFNEKACGNCHTNGAIGGAGEQIERRFGRISNGVANGLANRGGSLRQLFSNVHTNSMVEQFCFCLSHFYGCTHAQYLRRLCC